MVLKGHSASGSELSLWRCKMGVLIAVIKEGVMLLVNTTVQAISSRDNLLFPYTYFLCGSVHCIAGQMKVITNYET